MLSDASATAYTHFCVLGDKKKESASGKVGLWVYNHLQDDWLALHRDTLAVQGTLMMRLSWGFPRRVEEVSKHLVAHGSYSACSLGASWPVLWPRVSANTQRPENESLL